MNELPSIWDLEALATVVSAQGFEAAARQLHISQSAVSQRIRRLEDSTGKPLLIRSTPPFPTSSGEKLIRLFSQLQALHHELKDDIPRKSDNLDQEITFAINNDSLHTWFIDAITPFLRKGLRLQLHLDYEPATVMHLQNGAASACITSSSKSIKGCEVFPLGIFRYRLMCTPAFKKRYFSKGFNPTTMRNAPTMFFGPREELTQAFFKEKFNLNYDELPKHLIKNSYAFSDFVKRGLAYAPIPELEIQKEIRLGRLIDLCPKKIMEIELYWQVWRLRPALLSEITDAILKRAHEIMPQR